jgi:tripartite-type tricarboxylate transporter receptor subunit TctC
MANRLMDVCVVVVSLLLMSALVGPAQAQGRNYPERTVRIIVPFAAGGATDIAARVMAQALSKKFGVQFIADNRPGAGSTLGTRLAARSTADGYTLLAASSTNFGISPHIFRSLGYNVLSDFVPIGTIATTYNGLAVHPSLPVKSVKQLVTLAKAKPGDLFYSSSGNGTTAHLAMEMFKSASNIRMVHVPHKGADSAMMSVVSGDTQVASIVIARVAPLAQAGRLRALAVTGPKRSPLLPDVPTVMESGIPDYEFQLWGGLVAPAGTPSAIVQDLSSAMREVLEKMEVRELFAKDGGEALVLGTAQFSALIKSDYDKWGKAVRDAGVQFD